MKVLFVGEGECEVGSPPHEEEKGAGRARKREPVSVYAPGDAYPAGGVLPVLARKIAPEIAEDSVALRWREISRFSPTGKKGFGAKAMAALVLARRHGCGGLILVVDNDNEDRQRLPQMETCKPRAEGVRVACGLAIQAIEAWTLGAPEAIASVLGVDVSGVRRAYPGPAVEKLLESSGKEEQRPKALVNRLAGLGHREDCVEFRRDVAELTDVTALEQACPEGFGAFARAVRDAFGSG